MDKKHYSSLENMYLAAPINKIFPPRITIGNGIFVRGKTELQKTPAYKCEYKTV